MTSASAVRHGASTRSSEKPAPYDGKNIQCGSSYQVSWRRSVSRGPPNVPPSYTPPHFYSLAICLEIHVTRDHGTLFETERPGASQEALIGGRDGGRQCVSPGKSNFLCHLLRAVAVRTPKGPQHTPAGHCAFGGHSLTRDTSSGWVEKGPVSRMSLRNKTAGRPAPGQSSSGMDPLPSPGQRGRVQKGARGGLGHRFPSPVPLACS